MLMPTDAARLMSDCPCLHVFLGVERLPVSPTAACITSMHTELICLRQQVRARSCD